MLIATSLSLLLCLVCLVRFSFLLLVTYFLVRFIFVFVFEFVFHIIFYFIYLFIRPSVIRLAYLTIVSSLSFPSGKMFLSALPSPELRTFIHLMLRGLVPRAVLDRLTAEVLSLTHPLSYGKRSKDKNEGRESVDKAVLTREIMDSSSRDCDLQSTELLQDSESSEMRIKVDRHYSYGSGEDLDRWYGLVEGAVLGLQSSEMATVAWEKQVGYLHVLEHMVKILGFGISPYLRCNSQDTAFNTGYHTPDTTRCIHLF